MRTPEGSRASIYEICDDLAANADVPMLCSSCEWREVAIEGAA